jgi:hypothetical protein
MAFGIVPAREWQLKPAVGGSRRKCLLETPFDSIVQQITSEALLSECKWKKIRKIHDARRIFIKLTLAPQTVDLFHNGASGYRAQFYFGIQQGEAANRRLIDSKVDVLIKPSIPLMSCSNPPAVRSFTSTVIRNLRWTAKTRSSTTAATLTAARTTRTRGSAKAAALLLSDMGRLL